MNRTQATIRNHRVPLADVLTGVFLAAVTIALVAALSVMVHAPRSAQTPTLTNNIGDLSLSAMDPHSDFRSFCLGPEAHHKEVRSC